MSSRNAVTVKGSEVLIRPRGLDRLWCFKKELRIPVEFIELASVSNRPLAERPGTRLPGTDIGVKRCGTYSRNKKRSFWNVSGNSPALAIDCIPGAEYARVVLSVVEPEKIGKMINARLKQGS